MSALFLELARNVLFLSSSPHTFRLKMISSMMVPAPHGKNSSCVEAFHTQAYCVCWGCFLGLNLLPQPFQANIWPLCCQILCWIGICKNLKRCHRHYRGEPSLSLVLCSLTLSPSSNNMISPTNLPLKSSGPGARI